MLNIKNSNRGSASILSGFLFLFVIAGLFISKDSNFLSSINNFHQNVASVGGIGGLVIRESFWDGVIGIEPCGKGSGLNCPSGPQNFYVVDNGDLSVDLSWGPPEDVGDSDIVYYHLVYVSCEQGDEGDVCGEVIAITLDGSSTKTSVRNLAPGSYSFILFASNQQGLGARSDIADVSLNDSRVEIFPTQNSVEISWNTATPGESRVVFGTTEDKGAWKKEFLIEEESTSHSVVISGLVSCTKYWFNIHSKRSGGGRVDAAGKPLKFAFAKVALAAQEQIEVGDDMYWFATTGCKGGSEILRTEARSISGEREKISINGDLKKIELLPPVLGGDDRNLVVQLAELEKEKVRSAISQPQGKALVGDMYSIKIIEDDETELKETFTDPAVVSISYVKEDLGGIDPKTLVIYHNENGHGWMPLTDCSILQGKDGSGGVVTCSTNSFSIFGLFGEQPEAPQSSSQGSSSVVGSLAVNQIPTETPTSQVPTEIPTTSPTSQKFTKDLWLGVSDEEVTLLQRTLNKLGFSLAESGPGSVGQETKYFGPLTKQAVIRFQEAYRDTVLSPFGLTLGTGYFGQFSRNAIQALMGN